MKFIKPFSRVKQCQWCKNFFIYTHNRTMYCSDKHRKYSIQESWRKARHKYKRNYPFMVHSDTTSIGSGRLGKTRCKSFDEELLAVQKELKMLKIKA